jgi:hypothetical protein
VAGGDQVNTSNHHGSHRELLTQVDGPVAGTCRVDAIIVPTARPAAHLRVAIDLAAQLGCPLITLHSGYSKTVAARELANSKSVDLVAVDMKRLPHGMLPSFGTTSLLANTVFERRTDTSSKRNIGLLLARALGWQHIVFLDDDICIQQAEHLTDAVRLLHKYDGVGLTGSGFPDNSVVCHAHRKTGGFQDTFIGGGALAVNAMTFNSFFPDIYNEDWFFLLREDIRLRPIARTSGIAIQRPYDPFANDQRARAEELGDVLAEGIFWLFDEHKPVEKADRAYWRDFLDKRQSLITEILGRLDDANVEPAERGRMRAALKAARGRSAIIEPQLCVDYLNSWLDDRDKWAIHLDKITGTLTEIPRPTVDEMLAGLRYEQPSDQLPDQDVTDLRTVIHGDPVGQPVPMNTFNPPVPPVAVPKTFVKARRVKVVQLDGQRRRGESTLKQHPFRELDKSGADSLVAVGDQEHLELGDQRNVAEVPLDLRLLGWFPPEVDGADHPGVVPSGQEHA